MKHVIKKPVVTEKSVSLSEQGKYMIEVDQNANKNEIAEAAKEIYGVDTIKVNIVKRVAKTSKHGKQTRTKPAKKIAILTLKKDQKIELFEDKK